MLIRRGFGYDIRYEKTAEKFFRKHEDIRDTILAGSRGDIYKKTGGLR